MPLLALASVCALALGLVLAHLLRWRLPLRGCHRKILITPVRIALALLIWTLLSIAVVWAFLLGLSPLLLLVVALGRRLVLNAHCVAFARWMRLLAVVAELAETLLEEPAHRRSLWVQK